jgi:hypothetical protein
MPQLAHAGIDDRIPTQPTLPGTQLTRVAPPLELVKTRIQRRIGGVRKVIEEVVRELTPAELADE